MIPKVKSATSRYILLVTVVLLKNIALHAAAPWFCCDIFGSYGCHRGIFSLIILLATIFISGHFRIFQFKDISYSKSWQALESDVLVIRGSTPLLQPVHSFFQSISPLAIFMSLLGVFTLNFFLEIAGTRIAV